MLNDRFQYLNIDWISFTVFHCVKSSKKKYLTDSRQENKGVNSHEGSPLISVELSSLRLSSSFLS